MQTQLLHYFLHIARVGNFTKAAQELHIAQPALSKQIARLENELGTELFVRSSRGIRLTEAGKILLFHSERMLADWEKVTNTIKELGLSGRGYVKLGMYPTFVWYMLPQFLPGFVKANESIDLEIEHGLSEVVLDWVLGHHMEAGIVIAPIAHPQIKEYPLHMEKFVLLVPRSHPWYGRDLVHLSELHQQPLILSTLNRWYEHFILPVFKQLDIQPQIRLVVHQYDVIKELVRSELGVSLIPLNAYQLWQKTEKDIDQQLAVIPIDPPLQRQLLWIERHDKTRSAACSAFFDYVCEYVKSSDFL
ncbi:LysR family transcriptional regulator [Paenibacillus eucommiae]|uniref:DNA-binding transcriptional LysR family regulator n=1 Tax=Paenibacillus eucommiae TaxID=1355755 RepID=A0ABS4J5J1_9BACL|nr:LysR family transcriptional regulator [Paenibacillus eucommiae]MBP1995107.1 DNA-binding transcriptional LysR family regulator [Paenibacillus eucommiae]